MDSPSSSSATANSGQMVNVRLNDNPSRWSSKFASLMQSPKYSDVTLTCEGESIMCHRIILAACSPYFKGLFDQYDEEFSSSNEVGAVGGLIIFINNMKLWQLKAIVTFMYQGTVDILEADLPDFMEAAKSLQIKGLTSGGTMDLEGNEPPVSRGQDLGQGGIAQGHRSSGGAGSGDEGNSEFFQCSPDKGIGDEVAHSSSQSQSQSQSSNLSQGQGVEMKSEIKMGVDDEGPLSGSSISSLTSSSSIN